MFVSFNDGNQWEPLQMNLPVSSVRDLVIHDNDLVAGTHGRSFWILDDIGPLRQVKEGERTDEPVLFTPSKAIRWRSNRNTDTPLPPEEPAGQNPPEGAIVDYILPESTIAAVELEIHDAAGQLVRRYSSADKAPVSEAELRKELNVPTYWVKPFRALPSAPRAHRSVWDLRYAPPAAFDHQYPIAAIYKDTPRVPLGTLVTPGRYTLILRAGGKTLSQPLTVVVDPRIKTSLEDLNQQKLISQRLSAMMQADAEALSQVCAVSRAINTRANANVPDALKVQLTSAHQELETLAGGSRRAGGAGTRSANTAPDLTALNRELSRLFEIVQGADRRPTAQAVSAARDLKKAFDAQLSSWKQFQTAGLAKLNGALRNASLPEITVPKPDLDRLKGTGSESFDADDDEP